MDERSRNDVAKRGDSGTESGTRMSLAGAIAELRQDLAGDRCLNIAATEALLEHAEAWQRCEDAANDISMSGDVRITIFPGRLAKTVWLHWAFDGEEPLAAGATLPDVVTKAMREVGR
jgi:hypothetical protein